MGELDPRTTTCAGSATLDATRGALRALTPEVVLVATTTATSRGGLEAFERSSGALRWTLGPEEPDWRFERCASSSTCAYLLRRRPLVRPLAHEVRVDARDLRTGALVWSYPLGVRTDDEVDLHAVDGAVVVTRFHGGRTTLVRLGRR